MNRLEAQFGDEIQFVHLNVDDPASRPLRDQFNVTHRSQYALVDANGEIVQRWFGPLGSSSIEGDIAAWLANP